MNRKEKYLQLLKDERWLEKRKYIYQRDNYRCKICGLGNRTLQVHHKVYFSKTYPWDVPDKHLITVCLKCHEHIHNTKKIKTISNKKIINDARKAKKLEKFKRLAEEYKRHLINQEKRSYRV